MSINRALNVSNEGHKTTSAGRLFHTRIAAGKKLYWNALVDAGGTWNLWVWPLVLRVFGTRYDEAGIAIIPCTIRYIMMALDCFRRSSIVFQLSCCTMMVGLPWVLLDGPTKRLPLGRLQSFMTDRAARRCTASILSMFCAVWGHHTVDAYSSWGRTWVVYAIALTCRWQFLVLRWINALVEFASLQTLLTCSL